MSPRHDHLHQDQTSQRCHGAPQPRPALSPFTCRRTCIESRYTCAGAWCEHDLTLLHNDRDFNTIRARARTTAALSGGITGGQPAILNKPILNKPWCRRKLRIGAQTIYRSNPLQHEAEGLDRQGSRADDRPPPRALLRIVRAILDGIAGGSRLGDLKAIAFDDKLPTGGRR